MRAVWDISVTGKVARIVFDGLQITGTDQVKRLRILNGSRHRSLGGGDSVQSLCLASENLTAISTIDLDERRVAKIPRIFHMGRCEALTHAPEVGSADSGRGSGDHYRDRIAKRQDLEKILFRGF
jgi:hypothetical protein